LTLVLREKNIVLRVSFASPLMQPPLGAALRRDLRSALGKRFLALLRVKSS
jgi:hypothetical protein